jgi:hypothetical protein|nr:MAG TPA: hypothetical protein [Caudoviricetes sp.]
MNFIELQTFVDDWGNWCDFDKSDYEEEYKDILNVSPSFVYIYLNTGTISKETENNIRESLKNFKATLENFSEYSLEELVNTFDTEVLIKKLTVLKDEYKYNKNIFLETYNSIDSESFIIKEFKEECYNLIEKYRTMEHTIDKLIKLLIDFPKYLSFCEDYVKNSFYNFSTEEEIDLAIKELNTKLKTLNKSNIEYFHLYGEREALYEYKIAFTKSHCGFY